MQRILDIIFSSFALLVFLPLLLPVVIILKLTGEGEIFYTQKRVGRGGQLFALYKFATMLKNSPKMGTGTVTVKHDPRILPVGRVLRKTKINELPQLLNVLKGDMSIVGPRPQTERCFAAFPPGAQEAIKQVRPGLSGIGSIIFRNEEDLMNVHAESERFYDTVIMPYKGSLEVWYVSHQSLRTYLLCILLTAWVVVSPKSSIVWRAFRGLPIPPDDLTDALEYVALGVVSKRELYLQVAKLHIENIGQGFLSTLGCGFIALMYRAIDECEHGVLFVEESDGHVVGFVSGAIRMKPIYMSMLRHLPKLFIVLMPSILKPSRAYRIYEVLKYSRTSHSNTALPEAELLSIVVDPTCRGQRKADLLYSRLSSFFYERGVPEFKITVGDSLIAARKFYQRMGAMPIAHIEVHNGEASTVYLGLSRALRPAG